MTHQNWLEGMKAVTARMAHSQGEAVALLRDLIVRAEAAREASVSAWHVRQSRSLLAQLEHEGEAPSVGAELYEEVARDAFVEYRSAKLSAAWHFAEAALMQLEVGNTSKALELAGEAFSLAEPHLDPSPTYERLLAELRRLGGAEPGAANLA